MSGAAAEAPMRMDPYLYRTKDRYSGKAESYMRFRPSYPAEAIRALREIGGMERAGVVADVGSGTGIFSKLLLDQGFTVHAVEPNEDMRRCAERWLGAHRTFISVEGSAEETTLPDRSMDAVVSAQAFHWFDPARAVPELRRILRPGGPLALIWNEQRLDADAFAAEYGRLLEARCPDFRAFGLKAVVHSASTLRALFRPADVTERRFESSQVLSLEALEGRVSSLSYCPARGSPEYARLMRELETSFERHQRAGAVTIHHDVVLYCIRCGVRAA